MHGKVLSWASDIDPKAIDQAQMAASMPFVEGHLALMADAHINVREICVGRVHLTCQVNSFSVCLRCCQWRAPPTCPARTCFPTPDMCSLAP